jgi:cell fate (sporulation/competence/biofilm development) regulator YmcA (YheA/YmcA/DUF963 family)
MYRTTEVENAKGRLVVILNNIKKEYAHLSVEELHKHLSLSKDGRNLRDIVQASEDLVKEIEKIHIDTRLGELSKEQKRAIACEKILKNEPVEEYTQTAQELNAILNWRKSKNCKCGCNDEFQCCNYCFDRIPLNKIDIDCVVYHCDRKPDGSCPWIGKDGSMIDK